MLLKWIPWTRCDDLCSYTNYYLLPEMFSWLYCHASVHIVLTIRSRCHVSNTILKKGCDKCCRWVSVLKHAFHFNINFSYKSFFSYKCFFETRYTFRKDFISFFWKLIIMTAQTCVYKNPCHMWRDIWQSCLVLVLFFYFVTGILSIKIKRDWSILRTSINNREVTKTCQRLTFYI